MRSVRRQLTVGLLASFAGLLAAGGTLVYWAVRDSLYDQFDASLRVKALIVITATRQNSERIRVYFSDRFLREFDDDVATEFFQVFDADGNSIERSDSLRDGELPRRFGSLKEPEYWNIRLPNGEPGRAIGIRFRPLFERRRDSDDERPPPREAVVVVAAGRRELDATVAELGTILAGGALSLLLLTALMVPLVLRRGLRPLRAIAQQASRIDASSLGTRFPSADQPEELKAITLRLNDLLARLEASFERERRFSSDLAHELRTPLAELRAQAELMLKWPEERTPAADQAILDTTLHLEGLVTRLLALGRAEQRQYELNKRPVDFAKLIRDLIDVLGPQIAARGLTVETDEVASLMVETDPVLLKSILTNLLENAVNYAPPGSRVEVTGRRTDAQFALMIANPAPDLQPGDAEAMFQRLWRRDRARTGSEHLGLGLALSRSFAELLGLQIAATLSPEGVLEITLRGPA